MFDKKKLKEKKFPFLLAFINKIKKIKKIYHILNLFECFRLINSLVVQLYFSLSTNLACLFSDVIYI